MLIDKVLVVKTKDIELALDLLYKVFSIDWKY
jgi:hypothetical protein